MSAFILGSQLLHRVRIVAYGRIEEDDSTYAISHAYYRDSISLCDRARITVKSEPDWSTQWRKKEFKKPAGSWSCALKPRSSHYGDGIGKVASQVDRGHEFQSLVFASLDCG